MILSSDHQIYFHQKIFDDYSSIQIQAIFNIFQLISLSFSPYLFHSFFVIFNFDLMIKLYCCQPLSFSDTCLS